MAETAKRELQFELPLPVRKPTVREQARSWFLRLRRKEEELQLKPEWQSPAFALAMVTAIAAGPGSVLLGLILFGRLGTRVPLFYNQAATGSKWIQVDKTVLLITPVLLSAALYVLISLLYSIFKIDKRLANLLSWLLAVFNVCFVLAYCQIFSLTAL